MKNNRLNTGMNYQLPYNVHKQLDDEHDEINEDRPRRLGKSAVYNNYYCIAPLNAVRNEYVNNCKQYKY